MQKMLTKLIIPILFLSLAFISCDPGIGVVISNQSRVDRNIRVIYPPDYKLQLNENDSMQTYDHTLTDNTISTRDYYRYAEKTPVLSLDTINRMYSFNLKAKHEVIIESRWPASVPTFGQIFILDNTDTIKLERKGKDFKKRPKLVFGGTWKHIITDGQK